MTFAIVVGLPRAYDRRVKTGPADAEWTEAQEAAADLERIREKENAAQERLYAAVRVLYRSATKPEIAARLDMSEDTVKWIVEDKAGKRRRRTAARRQGDEREDR